MTFSTNSSGQFLATRGGQTWTYNFATNNAVSPPTGTTTVVDPIGGTTLYSHSGGRVTSVQDPLGRVTTYGYDTVYRLTSVTAPEGNVTAYSHDARGNVTSTTSSAKPGSGAAAITTIASFPATCTNPLTCNQPEYTRDANGNQTDYSYDPATGAVTSVTLPAPVSGGVRPQVRYGYAQQQAFVKDGGSGIIAAGPPVQKLTSVSTCQTTASCVGTSDEVKTTIDYGLQSGGVANNLLPATQTIASGSGSVSTSSAFTYDAVGNVTTIDGPLPGAADTTTMRYDAGRRLVGNILPDPDGGGPRARLAQRTTYDGDGNVTLSEVGTVAGTGNSEWAAFASAQQVSAQYDLNGNVIKQSVSAGGTTSGVTQYSYDVLRRLDCTVQRMDPAQWAGQTNACAPQNSGAMGPDRITKTHYNAASEVVRVQAGVGTALVIDDVTSTYTSNGKVASVKDAENNLTSYIYDGHDRLAQTRFPVTTQGANASNSGDYEELTYDLRSSVVLRRLRDDTTIGYAYDNLARLTTKTLPGGEATTTYGYDLLGQGAGVTQGAQSLSFARDALGRLTTQSGPMGSLGYSYDAAGRRTAMTYPGGALTINYDYDVIGNVTAIRENGAASGVGVLASYAFDALGRRSSVSFGNGTVQSFTYDAASRLASLTNNLGGSATTHDVATTFSYNPASQITSTTRSNDAYAWGAHVNVNRGYISDGLNRIMSAGGQGFGYDARGNLTSDGTNGYSYTAENLLRTGPGGVVLDYDPLGRLAQSSGAIVTRFGYDGVALITEQDGSGSLLRRYVHGPGIDNPIAWYEGSGLSDRRFLMADERGSIVSVTDSAGGTIAINSYDEWGIPAPSNVGRFGYTGQTWLPEVKLWYYKARMYSPTLGRFLQTDPIGYADGMNWYAYAGNDPVNRRDPSGTVGVCNPNHSGGDAGCNLIVVTGTRSNGASIGGGFDIGSMVPSFGYDGWSYQNSDVAFDKQSGTKARTPKPKKAPCFAVQDHRQHHDRWVAREAQRLRAAGYLVATEVSIQVWSTTRPTSVTARADIIATIPGSNIFVVNEIKTGNATFSKNQEIVYGATAGLIRGLNGVNIGLNPGNFISLSNFSSTRCPGL